MNRVTFLVDGFNLYHSVRLAERDLKASTKWLDIKSLCLSYLPLIANTVKTKTQLVEIHYFSALAAHLEATNPDVTDRHKIFIRCLKSTGILVELSRFKEKQVRCPLCGGCFSKHEEKETDVAMAMKLFELFHNDRCDTAILLTGDTDLGPAVRTANKLFPAKRILFAFPYKRMNRELSKLAPGSFKINRKQYVRHQFPDPFILSNGTKIRKPSKW